jgi:S1-C subfamily serine protease
MKKLVLGVLVLLSFVNPVSAKIYEMNPDLKSRGAYPTFSIGVTGLKVSVEKGLVVTVQGEVPGSPAVGKCNKGDVITGINGKSFSGNDPLVVLGEAVGRAETTPPLISP